MFIAIPTNDRVNIAQKSGRANEFAIFNLGNSGSNVIFKENPHRNHDHSNGHHEHSHQEMIDMFKENNVAVLIVDVVGKHFKKDLLNSNFEVFKTELKSLAEIAEAFKSKKGDFVKIGE